MTFGPLFLIVVLALGWAATAWLSPKYSQRIRRFDTESKAIDQESEQLMLRQQAQHFWQLMDGVNEILGEQRALAHFDAHRSQGEPEDCVTILELCDGQVRLEICFPFSILLYGGRASLLWQNGSADPSFSPAQALRAAISLARNDTAKGVK